MKRRIVGALIIGLGWASGCGGGGKTTEPDAAVLRDSSRGPETHPEFDTPVMRDGSDTRPGFDTPVLRDGADALGCPVLPPDGGGEYPYPFYCAIGRAGDICQQTFPPRCLGGEWTCDSWPRADQCTCVGAPPGGSPDCQCVDHKWQCTPDGGTSDAKDAPDTAKTPDTLDSREAGTSSEVGETKGCAFTDGGSRYPFYCGRGWIDGICEDVLDPPQCIAGAWSCGTDAVGRPLPRADQCTCIGQVPRGYARCECIGHAWKCYEGDGGSSEVRDATPSQ
jgi:hypothetical protein